PAGEIPEVGVLAERVVGVVRAGARARARDERDTFAELTLEAAAALAELAARDRVEAGHGSSRGTRARLPRRRGHFTLSDRRLGFATCAPNDPSCAFTDHKRDRTRRRSVPEWERPSVASGCLSPRPRCWRPSLRAPSRRSPFRPRRWRPRPPTR